MRKIQATVAMILDLRILYFEDLSVGMSKTSLAAVVR